MRTLSSLLLLCLVSVVARAEVKLPAMISDHAVLQKSAHTTVWGWADPNEPVAVTLGAQSAKTVAGADGKWKVALDLSRVGAGPFEMTVQGKNRLNISDILVGQVWVTSGQSNMVYKLRDTLGGADEIARSANPQVRQFLVGTRETTQPIDDGQGSWSAAGPTTSGDFTGVGYYFAKKLQNELHEPVGILNASVNATTSEQWTSDKGLDADPELKQAKDLAHEARDALVDGSRNYPTLFQAWLDKYQRNDHPTGQPADFAGMDVSTSGWTPVTLPGPIAGNGLPAAGAVWIRKEINFSAADLGPFKGRVIMHYNAGSNDYETIYWNGQKVLEVQPKNHNEQMNYGNQMFDIPPAALKEGKNVIAIRFFSPVKVPTLSGDPGNNNPGFLDVARPPLAGPWLAKTEYALPALEATALAAVPPIPWEVYTAIGSQANGPCYLFNGSINPLTPATISGFVWYQGEANVERAWQYRISLPLLIKDWRAHWGLGDLPFYYCQIPNLGPTSNPPVDNINWPELREMQRQTLKLPNTGMAVLIDVGNPGNLHPLDKKDPGERLALIALAKVYHQDISYSGPMLASAKFEGGKVKVSFTHADKGLVAKPLKEVGKIYYDADPTKVPPQSTSPRSDLQGFALCGADHKWVWADAKITGPTTVEVWSDQVPQPVALRYAWDGSPVCNLFNGAGLPASPFRTDDFPLSTAQGRYGKIP